LKTSLDSAQGGFLYSSIVSVSPGDPKDLTVCVLRQDPQGSVIGDSDVAKAAVEVPQ
jgi:hypothetical protein